MCFLQPTVHPELVERRKPFDGLRANGIMGIATMRGKSD
jgi:hypothetical protein